MAKKQIRDNPYYLERLKNEFPAFYADLQAGKIKSERQAFIQAGLKTERTRYQVLVNAWKKCTPADQSAFLVSIGVAGTQVGTSTAKSTVTVVDASGRLTAWGNARVTAIMAHRNLKCGDVMREIGQKPLNAALGMAMQRGTKLNNSTLISELEKWVLSNGHVP